MRKRTTHPDFIERATRGSESSYFIVDDGETKEISAELFNAEKGTENLIRIRKEEFDDIDRHSPFFTHFNLQMAGNRIGAKVAIVKILVQGYYRGPGDELPPLLSFDDVIRASVVRTKEYVSYDELTPHDFEFSMTTIKDVESLKRAILRRYSASMPGLGEAEMLSLGVGVTTLRLER